MQLEGEVGDEAGRLGLVGLVDAREAFAQQGRRLMRGISGRNNDGVSAGSCAELPGGRRPTHGRRGYNTTLDEAAAARTPIDVTAGE